MHQQLAALPPHPYTVPLLLSLLPAHAADAFPPSFLASCLPSLLIHPYMHQQLAALPFCILLLL
jgi:hypothetical protein